MPISSINSTECHRRSFNICKVTLALIFVSFIALIFINLIASKISDEAMDKIGDYVGYAVIGYIGLSFVYILLGIRKSDNQKNLDLKKSEDILKVLENIKNKLSQPILETQKKQLWEKFSEIMLTSAEDNQDLRIKIAQVKIAFVNNEPVRVLNKILKELELADINNLNWPDQYISYYEIFRMIRNKPEIKDLNNKVLFLFMKKQPKSSSELHKIDVKSKLILLKNILII